MVDGIQQPAGTAPQYPNLLGVVPPQQTVAPQQPTMAPDQRVAVAGNQPVVPPQQAVQTYPLPQQQPQQPAAPQMQVIPADAALQRVMMVAGGMDKISANAALYQMIPLAASNRQAVVNFLLDRLESSSSDDATRYAALDVLEKIGAKEAVPRIERWAYSGITGGVRAQATHTLDLLGGGVGVTAPAPNYAPPANTPGGPNPNPGPQPPGGGNMSPKGRDIASRLVSYSDAPNAAVEFAKLPTAEMLAVADSVLDNTSLQRDAAPLVIAALVQHIREPGVADRLAHFMQSRDHLYYSKAMQPAVIALTGLGDPKYMPAIAKFLASRSNDDDIRRAVVDSIAKNANMLNHPATVIILAAVLHQNDSRGLSSAASHALSMIKSPRARDALAHSPLLDDLNETRLRAMWDLGKQPKPYPPETVAKLQKLASSPNAQVAAEAKKLLH